MSSPSPSPVPPVPVIEISLAPPEEPQPEPYSPFTPFNKTSFGFSPSSSSSSSSSSPDRSDMDDDTYRSTLLTPPVQSWSLSPLRPLSERRPKGQGLKDEEFQVLLRTSKERSAFAASKKMDLRKEVALKAHKNKQLERRALFLSKIGAPPSPTAVSTPKTPPDSPAIFHYSLPSPGLCSPLALFEKLGLDNQYLEERGVRKVWVEQVDFRLAKQHQQIPELDSESESEDVEVPLPVRIETPSITVTTPSEHEHDQERGSEQIEQQRREPQSAQQHQQQRQQHQKGHARKRSIPSLEEITERFSAQVGTTVDTAAPTPTRARAPLPSFLNSRRQSPSPPLPTEVPTLTVTAPEATARPRLACTGRIRFPSRSPSPSSHSETCKPLPDLPVESICSATLRKHTNALPPSLPTFVPASPTSPRLPTIQITTTHVLRTGSTSPDRPRLTEANLHALSSRASTAREMLTAIRRRTSVFNGQIRPGTPGTPPAWGTSIVEDEKQKRRHSAPADMPSGKGKRTGFMHPVLAQPGGF